MRPDEQNGMLWGRNEAAVRVKKHERGAVKGISHHCLPEDACMLYRLAWIVLSLTVVTALSGCLVDKKKLSQVTKISRTTDSLRLYQPNDFIEYNVRATVIDNGSVTTASGTMQVLWESNPDLTDPIHSATIGPVLKETTKLTFDTASELDSTVIRYISQDGDGNITLHAIEGNGEFYWPTLEGNSTPTASVASPVIFGSPLAVGFDPLPVSPVKFFVMEGCGSGTCPTQLYQFSDSFTVLGDTTEITTNLGVFKDPFQLSFNGGTSTSNSGLALSFLGDIRDACGDINESVTHGTDAGGGQLFVMPEIGIVQADYWCKVIVGSGKSAHYTMTLNNTNISTPW